MLNPPELKYRLDKTLWAYSNPSIYCCRLGKTEAGIMCDAMDGMNAAPPAAPTGECRKESTSMGAGSTFSKCFGLIGLMVACDTAATP